MSAKSKIEKRHQYGSIENEIMAWKWNEMAWKSENEEMKESNNIEEKMKMR
jgi:hypothetical protein